MGMLLIVMVKEKIRKKDKQRRENVTYIRRKRHCQTFCDAYAKTGSSLEFQLKIAIL